MNHINKYKFYVFIHDKNLWLHEQFVFTTEVGFEPTHRYDIGLAGQRLNHSAILPISHTTDDIHKIFKLYKVQNQYYCVKGQLLSICQFVTLYFHYT